MTNLTAAAALRILQEAGIPAKKQKAPAGTDPTRCYLINGEQTHLTYLRWFASQQA